MEEQKRMEDPKKELTEEQKKAMEMANFFADQYSVNRSLYNGIKIILDKLIEIEKDLAQLKGSGGKVDF